jgi:hypothetical protein
MIARAFEHHGAVSFVGSVLLLLLLLPLLLLVQERYLHAQFCYIVAGCNVYISEGRNLQLIRRLEVGYG